MTILFQKGPLTARFTQAEADLLACQRLRYACFFGGEGVDRDRFDAQCSHLMVCDAAGGLVATARVALSTGAAVLDGYAAQSYGLEALAARNVPMAEIGRFCMAADVFGPDVLRVAWGALTRLVDEAGVGVLFGCTSFAGVDPVPHTPAFTALRDQFAGPAALQPNRKAEAVVAFADLPDVAPDLRAAPQMLRSYLVMGGWVSDHAVVDRAMNTLHVFTCVDVTAVPPSRARALRTMAQG